MKVTSIILLACCLALSGCVKSSCPTVCTEELAMVTVKYKDAAGAAIAVNGFNAVNARTGEVYQYVQPDPSQFKGTYIVVTDAHKLGLSAAGDTIKVTAMHPQTQQQNNSTFVVAGGDCTCHIEKRSGPAEVIFN